jgi:hypothetical protein
VSRDDERYEDVDSFRIRETEIAVASYECVTETVVPPYLDLLAEVKSAVAAETDVRTLFDK